MKPAPKQSRSTATALSTLSPKAVEAKSPAHRTCRRGCTAYLQVLVMFLQLLVTEASSKLREDRWSEARHSLPAAATKDPSLCTSAPAPLQPNRYPQKAQRKGRGLLGTQPTPHRPRMGSNSPGCSPCSCSVSLAQEVTPWAPNIPPAPQLVSSSILTLPRVFFHPPKQSRLKNIPDAGKTARWTFKLRI